MANHQEPARCTFRRELSATTLWTGGCIDVPYRGEITHGHMSAFVIKGSKKTLMVDTGHPYHAHEVRPAVLEFLDGRGIDYIFPTHCEFPHAGLLADWMALFPEAKLISSSPDWDIMYPGLADRMEVVGAGDTVDLGDREILFVPSVWRDLPDTLWAFDTAERILYTSDAFAYLHYHREGECDKLSSELPPPDVKMIQFFNERTMNWTNYTDAKATFADIDRLLGMLRPRMIAGAHGSVVDRNEEMVPTIKYGMMVGTGVVDAAPPRDGKREGAHDRADAMQGAMK